MPTWDKDKTREYMRIKRKERKAQGKCTGCGAYQAAKGHVYCTKCLSSMKRLNKTYKSKPSQA